MRRYHIIYEESAHSDLKEIKDSYNSKEKIINRIEKDIKSLEYMPRSNKTLISTKDRNGEFRRKISGKYSIIYKIDDNQIIILRIFNQKQNYLNSKTFILREKSQKYILILKNK